MSGTRALEAAVVVAVMKWFKSKAFWNAPRCLEEEAVLAAADALDKARKRQSEEALVRYKGQGEWETSDD